MAADQFPVPMPSQWFTQSWQNLLPPGWAEIAVIIVAAICGGVVGSERERHEKAAGLRTLVLVCLGSTIFTTMSSRFAGDAGRIASQIVVGIGFLGAGVILRDKGKVTGTTTAATIWVMASIGMVLGAGHAGAALALSILVRLILSALRYLESNVISVNRKLIATLDFAPSRGLTRARIERVLSDYGVADSAVSWRTLEPDLEIADLRLRMPHHHLSQLLGELVDIPEVRALHREVEETI